MVLVTLANVDAGHVAGVDKVANFIHGFCRFCFVLTTKLRSLPAEQVSVAFTLNVDDVGRLSKEFTLLSGVFNLDWLAAVFKVVNSLGVVGSKLIKCKLSSMSLLGCDL